MSEWVTCWVIEWMSDWVTEGGNEEKNNLKQLLWMNLCFFKEYDDNDILFSNNLIGAKVCHVNIEKFNFTMHSVSLIFYTLFLIQTNILTFMCHRQSYNRNWMWKSRYTYKTALDFPTISQQ